VLNPIGIGWFKVKRSENAKVGVKSPTDLGVDSHNTCGENNTQKLMENGVILPQLCLFLPLEDFPLVTRFFGRFGLCVTSG